MRKKLAVILVILLMMFALTGTAYTSDIKGDVKVTVNGVEVAFPDQKPFIDENGRTLVPVRAPLEAMGVKVVWLEADQAVRLELKDAVVFFFIGNGSYTNPKGRVSMDTAPKIVNSRSVFPIRFTAEAFGANVGWNAGTRTVEITYNELYAYEDYFASQKAPVLTEEELAVNGFMSDVEFDKFISSIKSVEDMDKAYGLASGRLKLEHRIEFNKVADYWSDISLEQQKKEAHPGYEKLPEDKFIDPSLKVFDIGKEMFHWENTNPSHNLNGYQTRVVFNDKRLEKQTNDWNTTTYPSEWNHFSEGIVLYYHALYNYGYKSGDVIPFTIEFKQPHTGEIKGYKYTATLP